MLSAKKNSNREDEQVQYDLGLSEPYTNKLYAIKQDLSLRLKLFETKTFVRSFPNWFYIIVSLFLIFAQIRYLELLYSELPSLIPTYQYIIDLEKRLEIKQSVYFVPIISTVILFLSVLSTYKWYNKKKNLALFTLFFMFLGIGMLTLALAKLLSQYYG